MRGAMLALLAAVQLREAIASVCPDYSADALPLVVPLPKTLALTPFTTKCANQPPGLSYENVRASIGAVGLQCCARIPDFVRNNFARIALVWILQAHVCASVFAFTSKNPRRHARARLPI